MQYMWDYNKQAKKKKKSEKRERKVKQIYHCFVFILLFSFHSFQRHHCVILSLLRLNGQRRMWSINENCANTVCIEMIKMILQLFGLSVNVWKSDTEIRHFISFEIVMLLVVSWCSMIFIDLMNINWNEHMFIIK